MPYAVTVHPLPLWREYQFEGLQLAPGPDAGGVLVFWFTVDGLQFTDDMLASRSEDSAYR